MRPILLTLSILLATAASAQQDTLTTDSTSEHRSTRSLVLSVDKSGPSVQVLRNDTAKTENKDDTLRITTKRRIIRIITTLRTDRDSITISEDRLRDLRTERRNLFTYWAGVDLGINTFITEDGRVGDGPQSGPLQLNNARSRFLAINFMEQKVEFGSHHVGLFTGLGLEFVNYKMSDNVALQFNGDSTWAVPVATPEFRKNKLRQIGVRIPLMLEFNTKRAPLPSTEEEWARFNAGQHFSRKNNLHLAVGVIGSYYFDTMYKQKYREGGELRKSTLKADHNLLPYRLAASARVGLGALNLFVEYGLTPLFEQGTAPELTPLTVGITLVGFN